MKQYSTTDEHRNFRTSYNSQDDHNKNMGLYGKSRGGEDG